MKLATYTDGSPNGRLMIVSRDLRLAVRADDIAPSLLAALQTWEISRSMLQERFDRLNHGNEPEAIEFDCTAAIAPLPRATQWLDGSAFPSHGERMVKAFELTAVKSRAPLMYQGCPDFLPATAPVELPHEAEGIDFEAELAVIIGPVIMGASPAVCEEAIRLLVLVDDVSLRALQPAEMSLGFGMIHSKPASVCSPVCVTPDELGDGWREGKTSLSMRVRVNGQQVGRLVGDEMQFTFGELIAHAAYTRELGSGTVIGSGTFSNADESRGVGCLAEKRALEKLRTGVISSGWMQFGDRIQIDLLDSDDQSIFGSIDHTYVVQKKTKSYVHERDSVGGGVS